MPSTQEERDSVYYFGLHVQGAQGQYIDLRQCTWEGRAELRKQAVALLEELAKLDAAACIQEAEENHTTLQQNQ